MATTDPRVPLFENRDTQPFMPGAGAAPEESDVMMLPDGGAFVPTDDADDEVEMEEREDGSVVVYDRESDEPKEVGKEFLENLAEKLDESFVTRLGTTLLDAIKRDKDDREESDKLYAEGLKRTGLGNEAPGGATFEGASKVVHPLLTEGCIDFAARVMKEVFPAKGPVKAHIVGKSSREKLERAERKKRFMNWQMTRQIREMRGQFEVMLTQTPLGGSQYLKVWHDERFKRARAEFVPVDDVLYPYAASDFYSAERKTHLQKITQLELRGRIDSKLYRDVDVGTPPGSLEKTAAETASEKIEGKTDSSQNEDGLRVVYEVYVMLEVEGDSLAKNRVAPYIVTVDESSGKVFAIYRNWDKEDPLFQELEWMVEAKFFPWRGARGLGLIQLAGSLSAGATGALRALLDSAHINNFPGGVKLKGSRMAGQTKISAATEIQDIEGPTGIDDIRKLMMPYPYNPPSTVLFELMKFMVDSGKGVIATAEDKIADITANAPVGTTLAVIEQGSVTYSSVHARMHATMERLLSILHRINRDFLDDEQTIEELGDLVARREDFQGPMDVVPVSDPNVFSETQRYAQLQAVLQLRTQFAPGSFKDNALLEQALRLLNYPNYEDVLNTPLEAEERDAVTENVVASEPQSQLEVYDGQDHFAHLQAHVAFMMSPIFGGNPLLAMPALPKLLEHCKKHLLEYYTQNVRAAATAQQTQPTLLAGAVTEDQRLAAAAMMADQVMAKNLAQIIQSLQQLQQTIQQMMAQQPNPALQEAQIKAQTAKEVAQIREQGAAQRDAQKIQSETQREGQKAQMEFALDQQEQAAEAARHTEEMAVANQNARIAEQSEQRQQDVNLLIEQLRQENAKVLADMREAAAADRQAASEATQYAIAEMQAANQRYIAIVTKLLDDKAAAAEDATTVAAAKQHAKD